MSSGAESNWIDREIDINAFKDERLGKRFRSIMQRLDGGTGESIPLACQDWANTKGAYRFFANERVNEVDILKGHFQSTRDRFAKTEGPILILHDTTEFTYERPNVGLLHRSRWEKVPRHFHPPVCGISMHSSLAVTSEGLPLGLAAIKFWTRKKFKGSNEVRRKVNGTRIPIEEKESLRWLLNLKQSTELFADADRCVHIGDRGSDIFELFCAAQETGTHFLVRTFVDRFAGDGSHTVAEEMGEAGVRGVHRIEVRDKRGKVSEAVLELRFRRIRVLPPVDKRKRYPELELTVIHASERNPPKGRERIEWKLLTDLPVQSKQDAIEKLEWYAMRWKIEVYHKILKSGCKLEESRLQTAERLVNLIAAFCIVGWRIFWMTMLPRLVPDAPTKAALTVEEMNLLDRLLPDKPSSHAGACIERYLTKIARLGGFLARKGDGPPGNIVMWRGLARLSDILLGASLYAK